MRVIVGITGASGVVMGYHLVAALKQHEGCEVHLVVTEGARTTWEIESNVPMVELIAMADVCHSDMNLAAPISSGSFKTDGMIVMPCSMKTLAGITSGYAANLLGRAVDVCLKEERRVVIVPREMPFGKVHLRNMLTAADMGCSIVPPLLTFYNGAETMEGQIDHIVGKVLRLFGLEHEKFVAWTGREIS